MSSPRAALLLALPLLWEAVGAASEYTVPEPYIQALRPKGLRVSIPDEPGIDLFAVHANINKPMRDLEAGQLSRDVLKTKDGRWVFEDTDVVVQPGDHINYWLYVQRNGIGHRRDHGAFIVRELVDHNTPATPPVSAAGPCNQVCPGSDESSRRLLEQRLRQQQELHEQRLRHQEELHREQLLQLQLGCHPTAKDELPPYKAAGNPTTDDDEPPPYRRTTRRPSRDTLEDTPFNPLPPPKSTRRRT